MSKYIKSLPILLAGAVIAQALYTHIPQPENQVFARWEKEYADQNLYTKTPIPLGFSRAFSEHFTKAKGKADINFETGRINVSVKGLDPIRDGSRYEVWLVENGDGPENTAAIDIGPDGDRIWNLGELPAGGSLMADVDAGKLAAFQVDMAAVMRVGPDKKPEFVIGGMQSIRFQVGREAVLQKKRRGSLLGGLIPLASAAVQSKSQNLIDQGRNLFVNGTFGGNGRTCATCHRVQNDFTIDSTIIATLPAQDPLFAFAGNAALPPFDPNTPRQPAFEFPQLLTSRGLILENIDGFDRNADGTLVNPPVFRMTPALFNMSFTAPYGDSACCADLQTFSAGAVKQHFTKSLNRVAGVDFVTPTATELKALEAFQLSISSPTNGNFKVSGRGSLLSTKTDPLATDINRPEVRGRNFFTQTNSCITCHANTVFSGGATNLDTGVEVFGKTLTNPTPTPDDGVGGNAFQIPQLFGLRKTHFFHNGAAGNLTVPIAGQTLLFTNLQQAAMFYKSSSFVNSTEGQKKLPDGVTPRFQILFNMTDANVSDVAAFLEAISKP